MTSSGEPNGYYLLGKIGKPAQKNKHTSDPTWTKTGITVCYTKNVAFNMFDFVLPFAMVTSWVKGFRSHFFSNGLNKYFFLPYQGV